MDDWVCHRTPGRRHRHRRATRWAPALMVCEPAIRVNTLAPGISCVGCNLHLRSPSPKPLQDYLRDDRTVKCSVLVGEAFNPGVLKIASFNIFDENVWVSFACRLNT